MNSKLLPNIVRLTNVPGFETRSNDVVYCRPSTNVTNPKLCIFFGGDVQDFTENMRTHKEKEVHLPWNLENTAKLLQRSFVDSHVIIIRPLRMEYNTFSCFENFVPCSKYGVPDHLPLYHSLTHLALLIQNIGLRLRDMADEELHDAVQVALKALVPGVDVLQESENTETTYTRSLLNLEDSDIALVAFSKGCVVLNQFLYEFNHYQSTSSSNGLGLIQKIKDMYWLDGGHSGGTNTWMTSKPLLETIAHLGIKIHIHVTPYQICDERRPWIKKEEKTFSDTLKKLGVPIERRIHFENIPTSLQTHFNVLTVFRNANNS